MTTYATFDICFYLGAPGVLGSYPTTMNIRNEMDGLAAPFGLDRNTGEDIVSFILRLRRTTLRRMPTEGGDLAYQMGLELGDVPRRMCIEYPGADFIPYFMVNEHRLECRLIDTTSTSTSIYDLLPSSTWGSLDEICAHVTRNIAGARVYVAPFAKANRDLLPSSLIDGQHNLSDETIAIPPSTTFHLPRIPVHPDSVRVSHNMGVWTHRPSAVDISLYPNSYHVDYFSGKVSLSNEAPQAAAMFWQQAQTDFSFDVMPTPLINISNKDILNREACGTNSFPEIYYTASSKVATDTSTSPGYSLSFLISTALVDCIPYSRDRWS